MNIIIEFFKLKFWANV